MTQTDVSTDGRDGRETERAPVRTWAPKVGARVRLASWNDYVNRGIHVWAHCKVLSVYATLQVDLQVLNGDKPTEQYVTVPLSSIARPIGWKDRYTITARVADVDKVLAWFRDRRGIAVHQSHYMPTCPTSFTPADNPGTGDWRFNGADVDIVGADECSKVFRVVKLETWHDVYILAPCEYCDGLGYRVVTATSADWPIHKGLAAGAHGPCTCDGGRRPRYMASMDKKEKAAVRKRLTAEGWEIRYSNHGCHSSWIGKRETVVKDWDVEVPA